MTIIPNAQTYANAAAARGAILLDNHVPGWVDRIDLATLDLFDGADCILGQLYRKNVDDCGGYSRGRETLFAGQSFDQMHRQAAEFGFNYTEGNGESKTTVAALNEAWTNLITARRSVPIFAPVEPVRSGNQFMVSWHGGDEPSFFLTDSAAEGYGKFAEWLGEADLNDCLSIVTIFEGVILETVTRFGE